MLTVHVSLSSFANDGSKYVASLEEIPDGAWLQAFFHPLTHFAQHCWRGIAENGIYTHNADTGREAIAFKLRVKGTVC